MSGRKEKQARRVESAKDAVDERRRIAGARMEALLGRALVEDLCNHNKHEDDPTGAAECRWCPTVAETLRYIREGAAVSTVVSMERGNDMLKMARGEHEAQLSDVATEGHPLLGILPR